MKYLRITTIGLLLIFSQLVFSQQKSIKASKQRTHFFYTSLNLQAGCFGDKEDLHWMPVTRSPLNQVSFSYKSKRKYLLQKSYTRFINLADIKAKMSLCYDNDISEGIYTAQGKLVLNDVWVKLATKWDRTSIKIGNFSLPFGHNPKVDPDYSFIPNIGGTDLGLSRDLGVLFKTPISKKLDIELSLTSGGLLASPVLLKQLISSQNEDKSLVVSKTNYHGDWLLTSRVGNSVFKKNEFGVFTILGKLTNASSTNISTQVYRVGFDWIYKHKEDFRMTNQILLGPSLSTSDNPSFKVVQQSTAELFMFRQCIIHVAHNIRYTSSKDDSKLEGVLSAGISYAFTPHTRFKVNAFSNYNAYDRSNEMGFFFQVFTGFGLR